jgi:hypothetical protein
VHQTWGETPIDDLLHGVQVLECLSDFLDVLFLEHVPESKGKKEQTLEHWSGGYYDRKLVRVDE